MSGVVLRSGDRGEEVVLLQKALSEITGTTLKLDGIFGRSTEIALNRYQSSKKQGLTTQYNSDEAPEIAKLINEKYIRYKELDKYAKSVGIQPAFLKAVMRVESRGSGFLPDGKCVILFEKHIFYRELTKKFSDAKAKSVAKDFPNLCGPVPKISDYYGGAKEWGRLNKAKSIDVEAALASASYGLFQIMGFNYSVCNYDSVGLFVSDMCETEKFQLGALVSFIDNQPTLKKAAINLNFDEFARLYNGPSYAKHQYHLKLRRAFMDFSTAK